MHSEDKDCFIKLFSVVYVYILEVNIKYISTLVANKVLKTLL